MSPLTLTDNDSSDITSKKFSKIPQLGGDPEDTRGITYPIWPGGLGLPFLAYCHCHPNPVLRNFWSGFDFSSADPLACSEWTITFLSFLKTWKEMPEVAVRIIICTMRILRRSLSTVPSFLSVISLLFSVHTRCLWVWHVITELFVLQNEGCKVNEMPFF